MYTRADIFTKAFPWQENIFFLPPPSFSLSLFLLSLSCEGVSIRNHTTYSAQRKMKNTVGKNEISGESKRTQSDQRQQSDIYTCIHTHTHTHIYIYNAPLCEP